MSKITYGGESFSEGTVKVYSGGLRVGTIKPATGGFYYLPKGLPDNPRNRGETLPSIVAVKRTLEAE